MFSSTSRAVTLPAAETPQAKALSVRRRPRVTGLARVGRTLTCRIALLDGTPTSVRTEWRAVGAKAPRARGTRYRLTRRDAGKLLRCVTVATLGRQRIVIASPAVRVARARRVAAAHGRRA